MLDDNSRWKNLLHWLRDKHGMDIGPEGLRVECRETPGAGKGLFAIQPCKPSETLFTIPAKAMINVKTLSQLYPARKDGSTLSATQMISLHLLLHKPHGNEESLDRTFGPYISTMPRDFESHPLTWSVRKHLKRCSLVEDSLLDALPPSALAALHRLTSRYVEDWKNTRAYASERLGIISTSSRDDIQDIKQNLCPDNDTFIEDYLWAWLNVNTRCIYYRLDSSPSSTINLTLCPVLDFANHTPKQTNIVPSLPSNQPTAPGSRKPLGVGGDYIFTLSKETPVKQDQEIFLRYGGHCNRALVVEYGFVNLFSEDTIAKGDVDAEIDVEDLVEKLFESRGACGEWMKGILDYEGYWGDWTMHSTLQPAHPSYRLITSLRLYHSVEESILEIPENSEEIFEAWKSVVAGVDEIVSEQNEQAWRRTVLDMCKELMQRAESGMNKVENVSYSEITLPDWLEWMKGNIACLWQEEREVARLVSESINTGVDF
ncbi:SET domain-containing protein [Abortiporus biennis]|nr:SET domain-containing protein [Abortiporus biennis]